MSAKKTLRAVLLLLLITCTSCLTRTTATPTALQPAITATPEPPTATPVPLAAKVNGEGIWLEEYDASLAQLKQAAKDNGTTYTDDQMKQMVLDDLVAQTLLAQKAYQDGFSLDQAALDAHINDLAAPMGGAEALKNWIVQNGYTEVGFQQTMKKDLAADFEKKIIISKIGETADQVHARQILVTSESRANQIIAELAGSDFATIAYQYDPLTGGDLGWFPQGYLTQPKIEEAAFALQPGQFSGVIQTELGYHIVYVIERDAAHPLTADARNVLQHIALQNWVKAQRVASTIEILLP
jgi:peptidyl-prolyl cis-trans isomerase C